MPAPPAAPESQWPLGPTHAGMAGTGAAGFATPARPHPVCAGRRGRRVRWGYHPHGRAGMARNAAPAAATTMLGLGASCELRAGSRWVGGDAHAERRSEAAAAGSELITRGHSCRQAVEVEHAALALGSE